MSSVSPSKSMTPETEPPTGTPNAPSSPNLEARGGRESAIARAIVAVLRKEVKQQFLGIEAVEHEDFGRVGALIDGDDSASMLPESPSEASAGESEAALSAAIVSRPDKGLIQSLLAVVKLRLDSPLSDLVTSFPSDMLVIRWPEKNG